MDASDSKSRAVFDVPVGGEMAGDWMDSLSLRCALRHVHGVSGNELSGPMAASLVLGSAGRVATDLATTVLRVGLSDGAHPGILRRTRFPESLESHSIRREIAFADAHKQIRLPGRPRHHLLCV